MTALRRATQLVGIAVIATVGVFLILEATEIISGEWRRDLGDLLDTALFPTWGLWLSGVVGAALAVVGVAMIAAQLAPPKKGLNTVHEVNSAHDGDTSIRGRAAIGAVRHELSGIDGIVDVDARIGRKTTHVTIEIDDRANLTDIENQARARLGHEFWINLGLADFGVNFLVVHHPKPPRVR